MRNSRFISVLSPPVSTDTCEASKVISDWLDWASKKEGLNQSVPGSSSIGQDFVQKPELPVDFKAKKNKYGVCLYLLYCACFFY